MTDDVENRPSRCTYAAVLADRIIRQTDGDIRLALPLGIGKPVTLVNALTKRACDNPEIKLSIFTALTLERPEPTSELEARFLRPAMDRLFGKYPALEYARMLRDGSLPDNIQVNEFFFLAGQWVGVDAAQQSYISVNYTHALDILAARRPNVVAQLLAQDHGNYSLSGNTDITVDLLRLRKSGELDFVFAGEVNDQLPFMAGCGRVDADEIDWLLEPEKQFELFSAVKQPVGLSAHAIGLHVSRPILDGGTLQIGIGAIGDAVAQALLLRHRGEIEPIWEACPFPLGNCLETGPFPTGLYAVTEMLVAGILELFDANIIRREADGAAVHAGFFVECRDFYAKLRDMAPERRAKIAMKPVSFTNTLYHDEDAKRAARVNARFVNAAMMATLLGAVVSDGTEDGQVVSGVGGQFNFVEQAFALKNARSVITVPATRTSKGRVESNIVWTYGHITVPRHMRDIVVTEYGIADLRGKSDAEVIAEMLSVTDSRFQAGLLRQAQDAGKIPRDYEIPAACRGNTPDAIDKWLSGFRGDLLPDYPFGTDFDAVEQHLVQALSRLKGAQGRYVQLARLLWRGLAATPHTEEPACISRLALNQPQRFRELFLARLVCGALRTIEPAKRRNDK